MVTLLRQQSASCLTIHAGDWAQGSLYETAHGADIAVDMVKRLNYNLMTLGNHEFDWGLSWPTKFVSNLNPGQRMLVANLAWTNKPANVNLVPQWEHPAGVCFIGVVTPRTPLIIKGTLPSVTFEDPATSIKAAMNGCSADARQRVVIVSHLGYRSDVELCDLVPEIDVIVGGHTHTFLEQPEVRTRADNSKCIVSQAKAFGLYLSRLAVNWDEAGVASIDASDTQMLSVDATVAEDAEVKDLLATNYTPAVEQIFQERAGQLAQTLETKESVSELLCDAMLWETQGRNQAPVLCFNNKGGVRNFFTATDVSVGGVLEALPFDNLVSTVLVPENVIHAVLTNKRIRTDGSGGFPIARHEIITCSDGSFRFGNVAVHANGTNLISLVSTDYLLLKQHDVNTYGKQLETSGRKWNTVTSDYLKHLGTAYVNTRQRTDVTACSSSNQNVTTTAPDATVSSSRRSFVGFAAALLVLPMAQHKQW